MADDAEKRRLHQKLLIEISDNMDQTKGSLVFVNFNAALGCHLPKGILEQNKTIISKLQALTTRGLLKPGDYGTLKEIADLANNEEIKQLIEKTEREMGQTSHGASGSTEPVKTEEKRKPGPSTDLPNKQPIQVSQEEKRKPGPSTDLPNKQPIQVSQEDNEDALFKQKGDKGYYNTAGKKGYMLILNAESNRIGTEEDVTRLKEFFGKMLDFEIDDPRSFQRSDLTLKQFEKCLADTRRRLNDAHSVKYYCFICVIMSHGNETGVATADGMYDTSKIRKFFDNSKMPNFAGKPKIFFLQACRGSQNQGSVVLSNDPKDVEGMNKDKDEADEIHEIPTDADSLLAYATTPGYKCFRRIGIGSWFLKECMDEFKANWKKDHIEEMLISVRDRVAHDWKTSSGSRQVPCTESCLTKRLIFAKDTTKY